MFTLYVVSFQRREKGKAPKQTCICNICVCTSVQLIQLVARFSFNAIKYCKQTFVWWWYFIFGKGIAYSFTTIIDISCDILKYMYVQRTEQDCNLMSNRLNNKWFEISNSH